MRLYLSEIQKKERKEEREKRKRERSTKKRKKEDCSGCLAKQSLGVRTKEHHGEANKRNLDRKERKFEKEEKEKRKKTSRGHTAVSEVLLSLSLSLGEMLFTEDFSSFFLFFSH